MPRQHKHSTQLSIDEDWGSPLPQTWTAEMGPDMALAAFEDEAYEGFFRGGYPHSTFA